MATPSKNSRVTRRGNEPVQVQKNKLPFWLYPYRPGKAVKPLDYFATEEDAKSAQSRYSFETRVGSWGNIK